MASTRAILLGSRGLWPFLPVGLALPAGVDSVTVRGGKYALFLSDEVSQGVVLARRFARDSLEAGKALLKTAAPGSASRDVRVLPVLYDAGDERWRTLQEAIGELEEVEFEDFPLLSGPRTMFLDLRQMRRSGLDFLLQHEAWLKKSGVWSAHNGPFSARARQHMPCPQLDALVRPAEPGRPGPGGEPKTFVQCHLQRPRPVERMSEQEALRQLLAKRAGYGDSPGSLASLVVDRLSLPRGQQRPVPLEQILPQEDAERLRDFEEKMLLSPEERAAVIERGFSDECFLDPALQYNTREYHRSIAELYACNLPTLLAARRYR